MTPPAKRGRYGGTPFTAIKGETGTMGRPIADFPGFVFEGAGALLCALVFVFLYYQSRIVFFGLWAAASMVRLLVAFLGYEAVRLQMWAWLAAYAALGFVFALVLTETGKRSAIAGHAAGWKGWPNVLRAASVVPIAIMPAAQSWPARLDLYPLYQGLLLSLVFFYNFLMLRTNAGLGAHIFRVALLLEAAAPFWQRSLDHPGYYTFAVHCSLAFGAMAMWSENQALRIRDLATELAGARREIDHTVDLDRLTGLLNQSALAARVEACPVFDGVVAVCDMDHFKEVNDRFGHLVGDEILRHIGHLIRSSIRQEDEAFRWGGDEFVVLFHHQPPGVASPRMAEIEARLKDFQVRGFGVLPISFSWGTADGHGRPLRDVLDEADSVMYGRKRARATSQRATSL